jgi:hypothetical protein
VLASPTSTTASTPSTPGTPQFPRRAPRTGTAYQVKVPAYSEDDNEGRTDITSLRPVPLLMSRSAPHETVSAVEQQSLVAELTTTTGGSYQLILLLYISPRQSWAALAGSLLLREIDVWLHVAERERSLSHMYIQQESCERNQSSVYVVVVVTRDCVVFSVVQGTNLHRLLVPKGLGSTSLSSLF